MKPNNEWITWYRYINVWLKRLFKTWIRWWTVVSDIRQTRQLTHVLCHSLLDHKVHTLIESRVLITKSLFESLVGVILILINWQIVCCHLDQQICSLLNWTHVNWCLIQIAFVYTVKLGHLSGFKMFLKFITIIINNLIVTTLYYEINAHINWVFIYITLNYIYLNYKLYINTHNNTNKHNTNTYYIYTL